MMSDRVGEDLPFVALMVVLILAVVVGIAWTLHKEDVCRTLKCPPGMTADNIRGECLCVVRPNGAP